MKHSKILITALALASLIASPAFAGDTLDRAVQKLVQGSDKDQPIIPMQSIFGHALIDFDNNIRITAWDGTLKVKPDATHVLTFPGATGTLAVNGTTASFVWEGATADAYETTLSVTDPTADRGFVLPDAAGGTLMYSSLATNGIDVVNSIWGASNGLVLEGATADAYETTVSPVDPTADQTVSIPNFAVAYSLLGSTLTTNTIDAANSIWGVSNGLMFEGATVDAHEIRITPADATADVVYLLPNAAAGSYSVVGSTLATNALDIANSVTGASNALVFEVSADAYEISLAAADPTADRTVTLPNATGTVSLAQNSTTTALTADDQAVTPGSNTVLRLTSDDATAANRTFTLSASGAITGQVYVIIGPATNQCEIADTGIQVLSAAWSPTTGDTLTLLFDGTNFNEIARSNN